MRFPVRRAVRRRVAVAVLAACFAARAAAGAAPPPASKVVLEVAACTPAFESALRAILQIELGDLLHEERAVDASAHERIAIRCDDEVARVSARSGREGPLVENNLRLDSFPGDAAPRAAALAALEALTAVDPSYADRIEARQRRRRPSQTGDDASPDPPAPQSARARTQLALGGVGRLFLEEPGTAAWGGRIELTRRFGALWDAGLDVEGALARERVALGEVEARLLSAGAWAGPRVGGPVWTGMLGIGGRVGLADLRGGSDDSAVQDHSVTRWWAGPAFVARAGGASSTLGVVLMVEAGVAAAGAEGLSDGTSVLVVRGAWLALSLNAGIRW